MKVSLSSFSLVSAGSILSNSRESVRSIRFTCRKQDIAESVKIILGENSSVYKAITDGKIVCKCDQIRSSDQAEKGQGRQVLWMPG